MPKKENDFKCLRCSHELVGLYDINEPEERTCPKCGSNSLRPLPMKKKAAAA